MKRRVAKKICNLYARHYEKSPGTSPPYLRRDLVVRAYQKMGLGIPESFYEKPKVVQDPGAIPVEPRVSSTGTSSEATQGAQAPTAAKVLTEMSTQPSETRQDLESMRVPELKALCKERGLKGYSKLKRGGLVSLLRDV